MEGCVQRHYHPQLHAAIAPPQLNLSAKTFHPLQELQDRLEQTGHQHITRIVEWSLPHPADENGNIGGGKRDKDQRKRLGLNAECRPLRVAVFGAKPIVTDSKTVIVRLERVDRNVKKEVFLRTTQKMCEMAAIDWYPHSRKPNHLHYT